MATIPRVKTAWANLAGAADLAAVGAVILVVIMMVLPVPARLLDVLLAANISLSLLLLLLSMNVRHVLDLSVFPTMLLVATLFRLALNVSSTRLILLHGYAGEIIRAFGQFVVGGNFVVGAVIFLILVIIQFVVITRGAERVAEVAARFTLDAMPGKQMSIDADLNAGIIDEQEARRRRAEIEREADFYGAMDGASKFVKGDAIAGIIITLVNILAGFAVGVLQQGLSISEALAHYTLLTIGDGLVAQIPALLVSTATGIIVTRAASANNLGRDLTHQLTAEPTLLAVTAAVLAILAIVPGLPTLPFLVLAATFGGLARLLRQHRTANISSAVETPRTAAEKQKATAGGEQASAEQLLPALQVDPFAIEIGYSLISLADTQSGGELLDRIAALRRRLAWELGFVVPPIRIRDNVELRPNQYRFLLRGVEVARGELLVDRILAMDTGTGAPPAGGIETKEPAFGLTAWWVRPEDRERLEAQGYTLVEPAAVLTTHLCEVLRECAPDLLGRQEVKEMLDTVQKQYPAVTEEVRQVLTLGEIQKVLQGLLAEQVSCRDLVTILESIADVARQTREPAELIRAARLGLRRQITRTYITPEGVLPVITLSPQGERYLAESLQGAAPGSPPAVDPAELRRLVERLGQLVSQAAASGIQPVLLVSSEIRSALRQLLERSLPRLPVLAYSEVAPGTTVRSYGMVVWPGES
ncbi:MAG: flagellar biosynthesis protein FlhA [Limnochordales bacterium]|nr:flagellar biosynthesis protein FlhA [Limnochordales bacterium]